MKENTTNHNVTANSVSENTNTVKPKKTLDEIRAEQNHVKAIMQKARTTTAHKPVHKASANEKRQAFDGVIKACDDMHRDKYSANDAELWLAMHDKDYTQALYNIGGASANSVIKKCIDTSCNDVLVRVKADIYHDLKMVDDVARWGMECKHLERDDDGDIVSVCDDKDVQKAFDSAIHGETFGDGLALVHDSIVAILTETQKQVERGEQPALETPYTTRQLAKQVVIQGNDSKAIKDVETNPIREEWRAVRRSIMGERGLNVNMQYSYISGTLTDSQTGEKYDVYERLPKYSNLAGETVNTLFESETVVLNKVGGPERVHTTNSNNANTYTSVSVCDVEQRNDFVAKLNLTRRQAETLVLRERGYGYKAIATYQGIRVESVKDCMKAIQKKAIAIGLKP